MCFRWTKYIVNLILYFGKHKDSIQDLVSLSGEILVSINFCEKMIAWHSEIGNLIDKLKLDVIFYSVSRLYNNQLSV